MAGDPSALTPIESLRNLGPKSAELLRAVGVNNYAELDALGSVEAYLRVLDAFPHKASLNFLWSLEAALLNVRWDELPLATKDRLRRSVSD